MIGDADGDEDDDTHFCLKCHATIIGLDNYVSHRKTGCSKNVVDLPKSPLPSQLLPPDEYSGLKADDFFSSLELQSSAKKSAQSTSGGKNFSGILTRSKITAAIQASTSNKDHEIAPSKSGKNVWIGGHQLKLGSGDNQSKFIKAVDNLDRRKEEPRKIEVFEESDDESDDYDYEDDEIVSDEDAPPRNHTGGKWKPLSPVPWSVPPPSHTGGKWKPSPKRPASPPPNHTKGKWKPSYPVLSKETFDYPPPPSFTGSKWSQSKARHDYDHITPSNHTKGKWNSTQGDTSKIKHKTRLEIDVMSDYSQLNEDNQPSPTYTKGKWIPPEQSKKQTATKITDYSPLRKSSGTVQYWCRPCNRRLASKVVYERHLKSELHYKRTLNDKEFDDASDVIFEKRIKKSSTKLNSDHLKIEYAKQRKRKCIYFRCDVCKSRVNVNSMGKHLISHYHCRRNDLTAEIARQMVLDNIDTIILQCPFQCSICKFYFNNEKDFLKHWLSDGHVAKQLKHHGYFWCSYCKFRCINNDSMYSHLISQEHSEVVAVINRSVPIRIKKLSPIKCEVCAKEFLLNIELIHHCRKENHSFSKLENQIRFLCLTCGQVFKSNLSLKRHRQNVHGERFFICTFCNKTFKDIQEAKQHRNSSEHKFVVFTKKHQFDDSKKMERKCEYCNVLLPNFPAYKNHLKTNHLEYCPKCPYCGLNFAVSQELTVHLRSKSCKLDASFNLEHSCDKCLFSCNTTYELLFHQVLHNEPKLVYPTATDQLNKKPILHYPCPLCPKTFPKSSLQAHLKLHTQERLFVCHICNKSFSRKNNWLYHLKNHAKKSAKETEKQRIADACGNRPFLCSTCGASFKRKFILQQHMAVHSGKEFKCPKLGCIFAARTVADLKVHFTMHSDVKNFACNLCDYRGKTKQQLSRHATVHTGGKKYQCPKCPFSARTISNLKRHSRLHTGSKPYNCPHCKYKCNNLENLRKHVLSTNKHPGKCIYECKFCTNDHFQSNFARDFKVHLVSEHWKMFVNSSDAASYIAGIYDGGDDAIEPIPDETSSEPESKPKVIVVQKSIPSPVNNKDPIVAGCSSIKDANQDAGIDEIFPMYIVSKDETTTTTTTTTADNLQETWNLIGSYDVEESGALVPFTNESEVLFEEHF